MPITRKIFVNPETHQIRPFWRGHLFLFDQPQAAIISSQQGNRLLSLFFIIEVIVRPTVTSGARWLANDLPIWWPLIQIALLTILVFWLVMKLAKLRPFTVGLYPWRCWSRTEKFYFLQILPIT